MLLPRRSKRHLRRLTGLELLERDNARRCMPDFLDSFGLRRPNSGGDNNDRNKKHILQSFPFLVFFSAFAPDAVFRSHRAQEGSTHPEDAPSSADAWTAKFPAWLGWLLFQEPSAFRASPPAHPKTVYSPPAIRLWL